MDIIFRLNNGLWIITQPCNNRCPFWFI